jgi:hypothetical protein
MALFTLQFFVTNILFSVIIATALLRFDRDKTHSAPELLMYCLGLGPIGTSLLLYYGLLLFPRWPVPWYVAAVLGVHLLLAIIGRKQWLRAARELSTTIKLTVRKFQGDDRHRKTETAIFSATIFMALTVFLFFFLSFTLRIPLDETDALKYGTLGKIFFQERSMEYRWIRTYPKSGFYQINNHAPSFPLLLTWEKMTGSIFHKDQDVYYKSISAYYAWLILAVLLFWLSKRSKYLALTGFFALLSTYPFFVTLFQQHLDSFRIFFLIVSWIYLGYAVIRRDRLSLFLLALFSGLAAFAHTIGAVVVIFNVLAFFIFVPAPWREKLKDTVFLVTFIIAFGWIHYILDVIWGFGWIFFKRNLTFWG